jgi:4-amino-4-deoxychorismate lyase
MYPLFESIALNDGVLLNREWHELRYKASYAQLFGKAPDQSLFENLQLPLGCDSGLFKLRISYNEKSRKYEFEPYTFTKLTILKIIEDNTIDYSLKYSDRSHLERLLHQKGQCHDILILRNGLITDSSTCNIIFFDGKQWLTPSEPLLAGTARARLLASGKVLEAKISLDNLAQFHSFKLINALRDFEQSPAVDIKWIHR